MQNHIRGDTVSCINEVLPVANSFSFLNEFTLYQMLRNENGSRKESFSMKQSLGLRLICSYFLREFNAREARVRGKESEARKEAEAVGRVSELAPMWVPCD